MTNNDPMAYNPITIIMEDVLINTKIVNAVHGRVTCIPPFGASILEPSFHLSVGHFESLSERRSLGRREVLLPVKPLLEFDDLKPGKRRSRFLAFRRSSVLIRMTDAPCNCIYICKAHDDNNHHQNIRRFL